MPIFHLVRHALHAEVGQVLSGRSDIALSEEGRAQAAALGECFARQPIAAILSSPRRRAEETAQAIGDACALPVDTGSWLDEIDFGAWTGRSFADLEGEADWSRWNDRRDVAAPPRGETMVAAVDRARGGLEALARHDSAPLVLVSHGDVIRGLIAHYLGLPLDRLLHFDVDPASVSRLTVGPWGGRVLSINERCQ